MQAASITFANFVCRAGTDEQAPVLLDLAIDIVIPAFMNADLVRKFGDARYLFRDVQILNLGTEANLELVVAGRFIKDTVLTREQVLTDHGLVKSTRSLPSAPSAFFVLTLSEHRLIYLAETAYAPPLQSFASTAGSFIRLEHDAWLRKRWKAQPQNSARQTLSSLKKANPKPELVVIPLTSAEEVDAFVRRYERLTSVEFIIGRTNEEFDAESMHDAVEESRDRLKAEQSSVKHRSKKGLDKDEAADEIKKVTKTGNQTARTDGYTPEGDRLSGSNEKFTLRVTANVPDERPARERKLVEIYKDHIQSGAISVGQRVGDAIQRLRAIADRFVGSST